MKKLILFELRKVFSKRLALIALIGILLFSALLSFSTFQNKYAFDQNIGEGSGKTAVEIDKEIMFIKTLCNPQSFHDFLIKTEIGTA